MGLLDCLDGVANLCTDAAGDKEEGRSFPSGHASCAWATMLTLTHTQKVNDAALTVPPNRSPPRNRGIYKCRHFKPNDQLKLNP
ncbi:Phosphatidic acid phosphatase type 2/haloperoxidase [Phytophthora cactorum]|nr:Phosphatidic acid phosphatase type 2/haloperoxidase [Phytophthora cactorum]